MKRRTFIRICVWSLLAIGYFQFLIKFSVEENPYPVMVILIIFTGLTFELLMWGMNLRRIEQAVNKWRETSRLEVRHVYGLSLPKDAKVELILYDHLIFWNPYGFQMDIDIKQITNASAITEQEFKLEYKDASSLKHSEKGYLCINYLDEQGDFKSIILIVKLKEIADLIVSRIKMHTVGKLKIGSGSRGG
ncbi:hypothetical protein [Paenibacillus algorifonticola]|uniref:hypothetical protein n=1 Tax=Paenibacillus algorifonticola TaxID=684063 RepID=UPI0006192EB0|nr:hypothetical protein [Paenibacillus algorifonticola]